HWHYTNQTVWLKLDDERLLSGDEALVSEVWTLKKRCGEPPFILQPKERFNFISEERQKRAEETLNYLQANPKFFKALQHYALDFKFPVHKETDMDAALYINGFWKDEETQLMCRFLQGTPTEKASLASNCRSKKLQDLMHRYLGRFYPEVLGAEEKAQFAGHLDQIWNTQKSAVVDYQLNPHLTRQEALTGIETMDVSKLDAQQKEVLVGVSDYLTRISKLNSYY
ncbi:MAG: hypothetical protein ACHP6H_05265, partial [Legionellales bacterium]